MTLHITLYGVYMTGQRIGYIRVSTFDQNPERQLEDVDKGRKRALSDAEAAEARVRVAAGQKKAQVAREFGISRETLYRYLRMKD
jgi:DNA invertase Pin-like site-specific DNA recombinase